MSLKLERVRVGISQTDAARHLYVSRMQLYRWEKGIAAPSEGDLQRMADLYGCTVWNLLEDGRRNKWA